MTPFLKFCASHSFGAERFFEGLLDVPEGCRGVFLGAFGVGLGVKQKYFEKILRTQKPPEFRGKTGYFWLLRREIWADFEFFGLHTLEDIRIVVPVAATG